MSGIRVLVVEDNRQVAGALESALTDAGIGVVGPVMTPPDAERLVIEQNPELALVDFNLQGKVATPLIEWLHKQGLGVIVMSGLAVPPASISRAASFLQKPFGADELIAAIQHAVPPPM